MDKPVLELDGISAGYGTGLVLQDLSLTVDRGEVLGIMGRNGVGKSTLLKTLMGLLKVRSGRLTFSGHDLTNAPSYRVAAAGVGYVPQGREVFPDFTIRQNLIMGNLKARNDDIDAAMDLFPVLRERARATGGSLSGGQQQQLAIARALIGRPALLVLDEPSEGIQPSIVREIGTTLKRVSAEKGMTIMLVEQNMDMITQCCDRVVFLEGGRIATSVPAAQLLESPALLNKYMAF